jgi:S-methylmethionine-dependent homocysteine/selenocysteine methylase
MPNASAQADVARPDVIRRGHREAVKVGADTENIQSYQRRTHQKSQQEQRWIYHHLYTLPAFAEMEEAAMKDIVDSMYRVHLSPAGAIDPSVYENHL